MYYIILLYADRTKETTIDKKTRAHRTTYITVTDRCWAWTAWWCWVWTLRTRCWRTTMSRRRTTFSSSSACRPRTCTWPTWTGPCAGTFCYRHLGIRCANSSRFRCCSPRRRRPPTSRSCTTTAWRPKTGRYVV